MTSCERLAPCDGGGGEALGELLRVASRIERLHRLGRQRFDEDELVRLALQRLWIALGETARRYCEARSERPPRVAADGRGTPRQGAIDARRRRLTR